MHRSIQGVLRAPSQILALFLISCSNRASGKPVAELSPVWSRIRKRPRLPDASVDLTSASTNVTRSTQTNESGLYRFDAVDPGKYTLQVKATGFRTYIAKQFDVGRRASDQRGCAGWNSVKCNRWSKCLRTQCKYKPSRRFEPRISPRSRLTNFRWRLAILTCSR